MISRKSLAFFWILILFFVQQMMVFIFPSWMPPLMLIGVIFYALIEGPLFGAVIGCYAGFLLDILSVGKLGGSMVILSGLGILTGFSASKIFYDSFLTQLLLPMLGNYFMCFFSLLFYKGFSQSEGLSLDYFGEPLILSQPLLSALVSPPTFLFLKKVAKRN